MGDTSRMKKAIRRERVPRVWFWDGEREYQGEAVALSPEGLTALLKMSQFGEATVVPTPTLVQNLARHFQRRQTEFRISGQGLEAHVKGRITLVQPDFESPRRLLLEAEWTEPSEKARTILERLGAGLERP